MKLQLLPEDPGRHHELLQWSVSMQQDDDSWVTSSGVSAVSDSDLVHSTVLKALSQLLGSADHS